MEFAFFWKIIVIIYETISYLFFTIFESTVFTNVLLFYILVKLYDIEFLGSRGKKRDRRIMHGINKLMYP